MKTTGKIYFSIKTENPIIEIDLLNQYLSIKPTTFNKMYEKGIIPKCTNWIYSSKELSNAYYFQEIEDLISKLIKHENEFINLKKDYPEIEYTLQIVIYLGEETPGFHLGLKVLNFLNTINAEVDCDIYNSLAT